MRLKSWFSYAGKIPDDRGVYFFADQPRFCRYIGYSPEVCPRLLIFPIMNLGSAPIGGGKIGELGVTKLRIADCGTCGTAGTCGTYIYIFFFQKTRRSDLFKHITIKNCDKILFTNTEKTTKSRHYEVKNHSEGKMCNID